MSYKADLERRIAERTATRAEWHARRRLIRLDLYGTPQGELVLMCVVPVAMVRQAIEAWTRTPQVQAVVRAITNLTAG